MMGYYGISWMEDGKPICLGPFKTQDEAYKAIISCAGQGASRFHWSKRAAYKDAEETAQ